jgi:hypothetical protein
VTDISAFVRERNAMLLACDIERAKAFYRKHNPGFRVPSDDVVEIGLHKARTAALSLPQAERDHSRRWLIQRGYQAQG